MNNKMISVIYGAVLVMMIAIAYLVAADVLYNSLGQGGRRLEQR